MAKPISPVDIEFLVEDSKIPKTLVAASSVKLNSMEAAVFAGFLDNLVGFIQIPDQTHGRLFKHCSFSTIGFTGKDGLSYIPVFVFQSVTAIFDSDIYKNVNFQELPWVVLYHGCDNHSYGRRFKTEFEANRFVKNGYVNGFSNVHGKLEFYNS